jgi:hypothetical protein
MGLFSVNLAVKKVSFYPIKNWNAFCSTLATSLEMVFLNHSDKKLKEVTSYNFQNNTKKL